MLKNEILCLTAQNDIATQPPRGGKTWIYENIFYIWGLRK